MKKTIFPLLFILLTTIAFAQIEPTITNITQLDVEYDEGNCVWVYNVAYCYWGYYNDTARDGYDELRLFNLSDYSFDTVKTITWNSTPTNAQRVDFVTDAEKIYAVDENEFLVYNTLTDSVTLNTPIDTEITQVVHSSCDLLEGTDTMLCLYSDFNTPYYANLLEIDVTTGDSSMLMKNVYYTNDTDRNIRYAECNARNSDEFWCAWGWYSVTNVSYALKYTYSTNTTAVYEFADETLFGQQQCKWVDDILYCYSTDDRDYVRDEIWYFDPSDNSWGTLSTTLPLPIATYGKSNNLENVDYLIAGWYGAEWDYVGKSVIELYWEIPETPEGGWTPTEYNATHGMSDVTGLVIDFGVEFGIQAIALAGIIALVGIAVWIRGRL